MAVTLEHKRGDSFRWSCLRTDAAGDPVSVEGVTITARFVNAMGAAIILAPESQSGNAFDLVADQDEAAAWVPGLYRGDIEFAAANSVTSTREPAQLLVTRDYANAP